MFTPSFRSASSYSANIMWHFKIKGASGNPEKSRKKYLILKKNEKDYPTCINKPMLTNVPHWLFSNDG
jgi:NADH:ubiquinone oxidoreductase subunit F (NADH-binding)